MSQVMERSAAHLRNAAYFLAGNLSFALAMNLFYLHNGIAAGGFAGIATVLYYVTSVPVGTIVFLMNVPLAVWAVFQRGWSYAFKAVLSTGCYAVFVDVLAFLPAATDNEVVAAVFGGLLNALGIVCFYRAEASAGGNDLLARLLSHVIPSLSLGRIFLVVDGTCVLLAMLVFRNIEAGLYAIIAVYTSSLFTDQLIAGFNKATLCYIVTSRDPHPIADRVAKQLHRSVTRQRGEGMYLETERDVLMVVVRPREVYHLKSMVLQEDPGAFLILTPANEVWGGGFQRKRGSY